MTDIFEENVRILVIVGFLCIHDIRSRDLSRDFQSIRPVGWKIPRKSIKAEIIFQKKTKVKNEVLSDKIVKT